MPGAWNFFMHEKCSNASWGGVITQEFVRKLSARPDGAF